MRVVVALGGNALLERDERPDAVIQRRHVRQAAVALAPLAAGHQLVLCHGNGPQVGVLALESQAAMTFPAGPVPPLVPRGPPNGHWCYGPPSLVAPGHPSAV
jgi:carbamate kinase